MDRNNWNRTARKAESIADKYSKRLSRHEKEIESPFYRCPWCGKIHPISDAQMKKIRVEKDLIGTHSDITSMTTTKTYVKTYYNVRLCKKCANSNERKKSVFFNIGKILYGILGIMFLFWLITTDEKLEFYGWLGAIIGYGMVAFCAIGLKDSIEENVFDTINIDYAYTGNAID